RGELGEELISVTTEIRTKFATARSPLGYGPPGGETDDGTYDYRRRLEEIGSLDPEFARLRGLRARQNALVGSTSTDDAIAVIFEARGKLISALLSRIRDIRGETRFGASTERDIERSERNDATIWQGYKENGDPIDDILDPAIAEIERAMVPLIRLEALR
ncbi:MAG: hypothetical protein AAGJ74_15595, partial [Pseudomonadota bacterium]